MTHIISLLAYAALLAMLAYLGTVLARIITTGARSFADGPPPGRPALGLIIGAAAVAGACIGARAVALPELGMAALLTVALAGICYADVRYGLVPDAFTLGPLAAILAGDVLLHHGGAAVASAFVAAPFGIAAALSKGRGMGWGDVKLVALGAAVLGVQAALLGFAFASLAAVGVAAARRRGPVPIAFAPYLAAGIAAVAAAHGVG